MAIFQFTKMNGAGNDFVLLDNRSGALALDSATIERFCDRHRGVGADGVLVVESPANGADFRMRYYNRDGGEAEMCGNGARCFARFVSRLAPGPEEVNFETMAGVITAKLSGGAVQLAMSEPKNLRLNEKIDVGRGEVTLHLVDTGVPHTVLFVRAIDDVDVQNHGSAIRHHPHFAPRGTNVNFIQQADGPQSLFIRTYERGVEAETLACGTGVVASALIFHEVTGAASPIAVKVRGGDTLEVGFERHESGYAGVTLTGPADFVFDGQIEI